MLNVIEISGRYYIVLSIKMMSFYFPSNTPDDSGSRDPQKTQEIREIEETEL